MQSNKPNIVLIIMDATRADHLSCYGYFRQTTPYIDDLAREGILFEQAISPAGWSLPSHASIFTGMFPSKHGANDEHKYLDSGFPTMAELLRDQGYQTVSFCINPWVGQATGLDRGFQSVPQIYWKKQQGLRRLTGVAEKVLAAAVGIRDSGARTITRAVQTWLRQYRTGRDATPFFLFIQYLEPHLPYKVPRGYRTQHMTGSLTYTQAVKVNQHADKYISGYASMSEKDFELLKVLYDSEITYLDSKIHQVLTYFQELDLLDDTMFIITADHGENLGDHQLMGHKLCLYDSLIRVPLIIRYPKALPVGTRVSQQVQTVDILPTIADVLDVPINKEIQGISLLSATRSRQFAIAEQSRPHLDDFASYPKFDPSIHDRRLRAIRTERYKYIWTSDGRDELYNLVRDPGELENLIETELHVAAELRTMLEEWLTTFEPAQLTSYTPDWDKDVEERLRALGYIA